MKLYTRVGAPNPRRVHIFLSEKGLDPLPEDVAVELFESEHKSEGFRALNPVEQVPLLVLDDGCRISESVAICRYFELQKPQPALFGTSAMEQVMVEMWQRRMELGLLWPIAHAFRHLHPRMGVLESPQIAQWGEVNKPRAQKSLRLLNEQLADNAFVAGTHYSIADITATVAMDLIKYARIDLPEDNAHLSRWWEAVQSRPSYKADANR